MPNMGQQLAELGIINSVILEEAIHFPGFFQIQAGNQLSPQENYAFRRAVAKTIVLQRERHAAHLQFAKLSGTQAYHQWIRLFAPFAKDISSSLQPIIQIICYTMNWPYAEVWSQHDTPGSRKLKVVKSFTHAYKRWFSIEPRIEKLAAHMNSYSIVLPSRELPSDVFTSRNQVWGDKCIGKIKDEKRLQLLIEASLDLAFIVPLKDLRRQSVKHAVVFYGGAASGHKSSLAKRFLIPTAQNAVDIYKSIEVIRPDEKEALDTLNARWEQVCTRHGLLRAAKIADRAPKIQRSRSFTCATNAFGEKL